MALKIMKTRILVVILLCLSIWITYQFFESIFVQPYVGKGKLAQMREPSGEKLTVTVFYECLCPDSKSFILNHLLPSFKKASHLLKLELIPYGKAKTRKTFRGNLEFECQHGSAECLGNKVHACVIEKVRDDMTSLRLISCLMEDSGSIDGAGAECSARFNVAWGPIMECARGQQGSELLRDHGLATDSLSPQISFVPTILLNQKRDGQPAILKNLWKEICRNLPETPEVCPAKIQPVLILVGSMGLREGSSL